MLSVAEVLNNQAACNSALGKYTEATVLYEKVRSRFGHVELSCRRRRACFGDLSD
jgi:hypothetical protein